MTLAEFLQQLVAAGGRSFILTQTTGDPQIVEYGQVWGGEGALGLNTDGKTLEGLVQIGCIIPANNPGHYIVILYLDVNSETLTIRNQGGPEIFAEHLQLHYFNGVLYGTATHYGYSQNPPGLGILPGPVYTLTFNSSQIIQ